MNQHFCDERMEKTTGETSNSLYNNSIGLLDLPWEQILCKHVLSFFNIQELFTIRSVSRGCMELVETHFSLQFHLNTCQLGDNCTSSAFSIMTRDSSCLKSLILRGAKSWLTNDALVPVVTSNPKLEKIDLTGCIALSGCVVYAIGANCPRLKHLSLRNCVWLGEDNLMSFICNQREIEYLDLSGCWNLSDEIIIRIVQSCVNIKQLLLSNLYGLTDRAVCAIAHSSPNLMTLCIQGCWRVTDCSVGMVAQYCLKLRMLQVKECRDVTEKSLGPLRQRKVIIDKAAPPSAHQHRLEYLNNLQRINLAL